MVTRGFAYARAKQLALAAQACYRQGMSKSMIWVAVMALVVGCGSSGAAEGPGMPQGRSAEQEGLDGSSCPALPVLEPDGGPPLDAGPGPDAGTPCEVLPTLPGWAVELGILCVHTVVSCGYQREPEVCHGCAVVGSSDDASDSLPSGLWCCRD